MREDGEEKESFWILNIVGNGYRLFVLRDLNRFIGDRLRVVLLEF